MIASLMMYGILVSLLITAAAFAAERALASAALPRRPAWLAALLLSLVLPASLLWQADAQRAVPNVGNDPIQLADDKPSVSTDPPEAFVDTATRRSQALRWPTLPTLDTALKILWLLGTMMLAVYYTIGWMRLRRALAAADKTHIDGQTVCVSDHLGPAVFGFVRPAIVVPRWLLSAPTDTCRLAMEHERQHIAARDQLAVLAGLVAVTVAPWNVALWWQLRRLRFAVEVDCDARVLSRGEKVEAYGATLLSVGECSAGRMTSALTLTEPPSDLEKRIRIMLRPARRYAALAIAASCVLCVSLIAAAASVQAPLRQESLRYPMPAQPQPIREQIDKLARDRFPGYFSSSSEQPVLIRMLLRNDLSIETATAADLDPGTTFETADRPHASNDGFDPSVIATEDPRIFFRYTLTTPQRRQVYMSVAVRVVAASRSPAIVEAALRRHSPQLLDEAADSDTMVAVLMNGDGTVQRAQIMPPPAGNFWAAREMERQAFDALHLADAEPHTNAYIASSRKEPPYRPNLVYFFPKGEHPADDVDPSRITAPSDAVTERALLERYFPEITDGSVQPHQLLWFLIDESGAIARTGRSNNPPSELQAELESLGFPTKKFHVTEVGQLLGRRTVDDHGEPLMAAFTWFNPELKSEAPRSDLMLDAHVYRDGILVQSGPLSLAFDSMRISDVPDALRIEVTARSVDAETVMLQTNVRVPARKAVEFADAWETITRPALLVRYDTEAVVEHGVHYPQAVLPNGKDSEVWRITLKPRRTP